LVERFKSFECVNAQCDFTIWKTIAGRLFTREEVMTLITDRQIGPLTGFLSKARKRFSAIVKLTEDFKVEFDFAATTEAAKTAIHCDKCGSAMIIRQGRRGEFLACSKYPDCKNALSFRRDEAGTIIPLPKAPEITTDEKCEKCGAPMAVRGSRRGPFLACTGYPKCKNAKPLPEDLKAKVAAAKAARPAPVMTDEKCEKCGAPMVRRQGRFGEFLGCSAYPKCKTIKKVTA
jgi:DNA topoisomerase-1